MYAEQELNKLRKEYEDRFNLESEKVRSTRSLICSTEKERERRVVAVR